jgi:hypothetical protein
MRAGSARVLAGGSTAAILACVLSFTRPASAVDARAEAAAKDALKKAAEEFDAKDYATAAARLDGAARGCGSTRCSRMTEALVLRDLGTMQLRTGDAAAAATSFAQALKLEPDLALRSKYVAPDVSAEWERAKRAAAPTPPPAPPPAPTKTAAAPAHAEQPTGDFVHAPAPEQQAGTPLPVYAEYPGSPAAARVVVRYKGAAMGDWGKVDLKRHGEGWAGLVPCGDVTTGTLRYWIQGYDADATPVANSGDTKHPFSVAIKDEISGEAPHLPGEAAPKKCSDKGDGDARGDGDAQGDAGESASTPADAPPPERSEAYARLWVGASFALDVLSMPSGTDVCALSSSGVPTNSSNIYCTNPDGSDFPSRASPKQNQALVPGDSGRSSGGLVAGDLRFMLSVDYAILPNLLVGGRIGYVANSYTGSVAAKDGRAAGFKIHGEARATYLFGDAPLGRVGFLPMVFAGAGAAEFDGHSPTLVAMNGIAGLESVDVWKTDGPLFFMAGGGARYQLSPRVAATGALRVNLALGNGPLVTFGPEVGVAYGF